MGNNSLTMHHVYQLSDEHKLDYLDHLVLRHPCFERAARSLAAQLHPSSEVSTILLRGRAGAGKTTLLRYLQKKSGWTREMGFVTWPRAHALSVRHVVDQLAGAAVVADRPVGGRRTSLWEQLRYVPRILVIDDVVDSSCGAAQRSALAALLAWNSGAGRKVVLVGSDKVGKVIADLPSGRLRAGHVYLAAYGTRQAGQGPQDVPSGAGAASAGYRNLLDRVRQHWPYEDRPDFAAAAAAIHAQTRGNMALTKQLYLAWARKQASNGGKWDGGGNDD